jgi:hypothetical protein
MASLDFYSAIYKFFDLDTEDVSVQLLTAINGGRRLLFNSFLVDKTAGWTPAIAEFGCNYTYTSASGGTCTLPQDSAAAFPIGYEFIVYTRGAGAVTYAAGAGATVNALAGDLVGTGQYSRSVVTKIAANTWQVSYGL